MKASVIFACSAASIILSACNPSQPTAETPRPQSSPLPIARPTTQPAPSALPATPVRIAPTPAAAALPVANWDEFSFEQVTTVGDQKMQSKWAVKKGRVRIEAEIMGQPVIFVGDRDKQVGYQWVQGQNQMIKMSYDDLEQAAAAPPDLHELSVDASMGTPAGNDTVDSQTCDIYEVTGSAATLRVWVSRNNTLPIKSEITTAEGTVTTEFRSLKQGNLPDDLFEPPAGMKIVESVAQLP